MLDPIVRRLIGVLILLFIMGVLSAQDDKNVLIIGIDGLRGDAFMAAETPTMDHFMNDGEYSYDCDAGERTINGPSWTSILTGVWHKKHNIKSDAFKKPMLDDYPHFYRYIEHETELRTASVVNLVDINQHIDCCSDIPLQGKIDRSVQEKAKMLIEADMVDVIFTQFADVDEAGRLSAYHPQVGVYIRAIERMDRIFLDLIQTVKSHASLHGEEWLVLILTDHGGEGNEHIGKQKHTAVRMVPQIVAVVKSDGSVGIELEDHYISLTDAANVNIAPTVLDYLGIDKPEYLDGNSYLMPYIDAAGF